MAEHKQIYQQAVYYDIVFDRDVRRDIAFLNAALHHHGGRAMGSILDIACGPGYHAAAGAAAGLRAIGMDLREEMLEFARSRARGVEVDWIVGDMCDFHVEEPVDVAICMYDSIDAMITDEMMINHFRAVAGNLSPEGLYVIECIHPRDCSPTHYGLHRHRGSRNGILVECVVGTNRPQFDPVTGIGDVEFQMRVFEDGGITTTSELSRERLYNPQIIELLARLSGVLKVAGWYGTFDLNQPLDNSERSDGMIGVLQKL